MTFRLPSAELVPRGARQPVAPLPSTVCPYGGRVAARGETPADIPFLLALYAELRRPEMMMVGWDEATKADFVARQFEYQYRHHSGSYPTMDHHILEYGGRPVGRLYLDWGTGPGSCMRVVDLLLAERWRERGIGRAVMIATLATAAAHGRDVTLAVDPYSRARRFYSGLGFLPEGPPTRGSLPMRWTKDRGAIALLQVKQA